MSQLPALALVLLVGGLPEQLLASPSPYLQEAAASPVHWRLWGPEALAESKASGKPLLVDVGAGWCHWCHVMDEGTYARPEVAALINGGFVPVKIDRDLSPDLDARFQRDAERLAGVGGWPLTIFLDPDERIYSAASYVPAERMPVLLGELAEGWKEPPPQLLRIRQLAVQEEAARPAAPVGKLSLGLATGLGAELVAELDPAHGGFGRDGPKFPNGPAVQLALALADRAGGPGPLLEVATQTLDAMARGGVRDHVGGGFHRYSVDPAWQVPHFEKLLYVNSALLSAYLDGWRATESQVYREVANELCDFLLSPAGSDAQHGGFYASQDSDVGRNDDGSFYTWTFDELRLVGGDEAVRLFGVQPDPSRRQVLREPELQLHPAALIKSLRKARAARMAPRVDETKYASWNGLAIAAMLEAGVALGRTDASRAALRALDLFLAHSLGAHGVTGAGVVAGDSELRRLDDLSELGLAALAAFEATGRVRYLGAADQLEAIADQTLWDEAAGCYRESTAALRSPPGIEDAPTPAPEAAMALFLARLTRLSGEDGAGQRADRLLARFAGEASGHGSFAATYGLAVLERLAPGPHVAIVGRRGADPLRAAAFAAWRPGKLVRSYGADEKAPYPAGAGNAALAYVCGQKSCAPPTDDPRRLADLIQSWDR